MTKEQVMEKIREMLKSTNELSQEEYCVLVGESNSLEIKKNIMNLVFEYSKKLFVENEQECFDLLCEACNEFFRNQSDQSYSRKRNIRNVLMSWLEKISMEFNLVLDRERIDSLNYYISKDPYIEFIKAFHDRKGVSSKELQDLTGLSQRSVNLWVKALDPNHVEAGNNQRTEIRIGGQLVKFAIKEKKDGHNKRYFAENTVHPLVFQNNLMQVLVMLKSFQDVKEYQEFNVGMDLAINTWIQLSEYAQKRLLELNDSMDYLSEEFIEKLIQASSSKSLLFLTEKEYFSNTNHSIKEKLMMACKSGSEVICILKNGERYVGKVSFSYGDIELILPNGSGKEIDERDVVIVEYNV